MFAYVRALFVSRHKLALEAVALGQQLAVFKRKQSRPKLRAGFRLFWRWGSRFRHPGRPKIGGEIRQLIRRVKTDNPSWGSPRIHGELLQLGFEISEPNLSRYLRRLKRDHDKGKAKRWAAFLNNHREVIAAFDFLYCSHIDFSRAPLLVCN
jgi:hypothetical protein